MLNTTIESFMKFRWFRIFLRYLDMLLTFGKSGKPVSILNVSKGRWVVGYYQYVESGDSFPASVFIGKVIGQTDTGTTLVDPTYIMASRQWISVLMKGESIVHSFLLFPTAWMSAVYHKKIYMKY